MVTWSDSTTHVSLKTAALEITSQYTEWHRLGNTNAEIHLEPLEASSNEHTCTCQNIIGIIRQPAECYHRCYGRANLSTTFHRISYKVFLEIYNGKLGWHFLVSQSKTDSVRVANKHPRKLKVVY
ncbi:rRNA biogenesis protein rrp5 [Fusarium oxysporum f. sp. albedinis]|nr:rRNA biogenesis protein rrp5 [Fusarium oxysporum f. sp. albedinis]